MPKFVFEHENYWCKYCGVYVKNTPIARRQHEESSRHRFYIQKNLDNIRNNAIKTHVSQEAAKAQYMSLFPNAYESFQGNSKKTDSDAENLEKARTEDEAQQLTEDKQLTEAPLPGKWQVVTEEELNFSKNWLNKKRSADCQDQFETDEISLLVKKEKVPEHYLIDSFKSVESEDASPAVQFGDKVRLQKKVRKRSKQIAE